MTRTNPDRHRFTIVRTDGTTDSVDLETRSMLIHDLVHYSVEMEVPFREGFYGLLAKGKGLSELNDKTQPWPVGTEIATAEALVGPLQTVLKAGNFDALAARARLSTWGFRSPSAPCAPNPCLNIWGFRSPSAPCAPNPCLSTWGFRSPSAPCAPNPRFDVFRADPPSVELLERIGARFRAVHGRYLATRFGETLELEWPEGQTSAHPAPRRDKRRS